LTDFASLLDRLVLDSTNLLLVGDFNYHVDNSNEADVSHFLELLASHDLVQHVQGPTHKAGHILDLVITRASEHVVECVTIRNPQLSDHLSVEATLHLSKPPPVRKEFVTRNLRNLDTAEFYQDMQRCQQQISLCDDPDTAVTRYNSMLRAILDKHAPEKTKSVTVRPNTEWYNDEIRTAKQRRRQLERKWRQTNLEIHRQIYCQQRQTVINMIHASKLAYYQAKVVEADNQRDLFNVVDTLLHRPKSSPLPAHTSAKQLADEFCHFFNDKIQRIRDDVADSMCPVYTLGDTDPPEFSTLSSFTPATQEEVRKILGTAPSKSCPLDPIPTKVVKRYADVTVTMLTDVINRSLEAGTVPTCLKQALVRPLLKKHNLDAEALNNYRPVSNLSFISKQLERVVASRLSTHMAANNLYEVFQSAYKTNHSTETALMRVHNDILCAMDGGKVAVLVMLDLSSAFDTVDHILLLERLQRDLGVSDKALSWFRSYLEDRTQRVIIDGHSSSEERLQFGVPQGSVLGPQLFSLYTAPLGRIIRKHGLQYHFYADDTQLYLFIEPVQDEVDNAVERIERCVREIRAWLRAHFLKCNSDKTELLVIGSQRQVAKISLPGVVIGETTITTSDSVRNLGAMFDTRMSMEAHVGAVCRSVRFHLRNIGKIRRFLSTEACEMVIHALVTCRLDMNNALLCGLPRCLMAKLQRCQNVAARIVTCKKQTCHIIPVLRELHWLPVIYRVQFKILLHVYRALNGRAPTYIGDILHPYKQSRSLRSSADSLRLFVPRMKHSWGDRAFSKSGPTLWNNLPMAVRSAPSLEAFKRSLKTFLFATAYAD